MWSVAIFDHEKSTRKTQATSDRKNKMIIVSDEDFVQHKLNLNLDKLMA